LVSNEIFERLLPEASAGDLEAARQFT